MPSEQTTKGDKPAASEEQKPQARPSIEDSLPGLTDKELATLHANGMRLRETGAGRLRNEAERLVPLIEAEVEKRRAAAPPPRVRKTAAKKTPAARAKPRK